MNPGTAIRFGSKVPGTASSSLAPKAARSVIPFTRPALLGGARAGLVTGISKGLIHRKSDDELRQREGAGDHPESTSRGL